MLARKCIFEARRDLGRSGSVGANVLDALSHACRTAQALRWNLEVHCRRRHRLHWHG